MTYKVVSTIKHGTKDGNVFFDAGESITAKDVGGKEALEELINAGSVVDAADYKELVVEVPENQAMGTPSNLEQITGTELEASAPEDTK